MQDELDAIAQRNAGMAASEIGAGKAWLQYAQNFIIEYVKTHDTLFCDDLWSAGLIRPEQPKALGPAIANAARAGLIERTNEYRQSIISNMSWKPIWKVV